MVFRFLDISSEVNNLKLEKPFCLQGLHPARTSKSQFAISPQSSFPFPLDWTNSFVHFSLCFPVPILLFHFLNQLLLSYSSFKFPSFPFIVISLCTFLIFLRLFAYSCCWPCLEARAMAMTTAFFWGSSGSRHVLVLFFVNWLWLLPIPMWYLGFWARRRLKHH